MKFEFETDEIGNVSDGYHTFNDLYHQRAILFAAICNQNKAIAWKAKKHSDGSMFGDNWFIVGVETPQGSYTYHYEMKYWDKFAVKERGFAPEWDGHTDKDVERLLSLYSIPQTPCEICDPVNDPICTQECHKVCPHCPDKA